MHELKYLPRNGIKLGPWPQKLISSSNRHNTSIEFISSSFMFIDRYSDQPSSIILSYQLIPNHIIITLTDPYCINDNTAFLQLKFFCQQFTVLTVSLETRYSSPQSFISINYCKYWKIILLYSICNWWQISQ